MPVAVSPPARVQPKSFFTCETSGQQLEISCRVDGPSGSPSQSRSCRDVQLRDVSRDDHDESGLVVVDRTVFEQVHARRVRRIGPRNSAWSVLRAVLEQRTR